MSKFIVRKNKDEGYYDIGKWIDGKYFCSYLKTNNANDNEKIIADNVSLFLNLMEKVKK